MKFTNAIILPLLAGGLSLLAGCVDPNTPYYGGRTGGYQDPYSQPTYGSSYDYDRQRELDRERRDVDLERYHVEEERRRLEDVRSREADEARRNADEARHNTERPRAEERCPSGYSPSEQKCSFDDRRHGCKDMRLPGGLGCVHR